MVHGRVTDMLGRPVPRLSELPDEPVNRFS